MRTTHHFSKTDLIPGDLFTYTAECRSNSNFSTTLELPLEGLALINKQAMPVQLDGADFVRTFRYELQAIRPGSITFSNVTAQVGEQEFSFPAISAEVHSVLGTETNLTALCEWQAEPISPAPSAPYPFIGIGVISLLAALFIWGKKRR